MDEEIEITVTDHAVIRFLERRLGMDINEIKRNIVEDHLDHIRYFKSCDINSKNGKLIVRNYKVITII